MDGHIDAGWVPELFESFIRSQVEVPSPISLDLELAFDMENRELTVECDGRPEEPIEGQPYLRFILIESDLKIPGNNLTYNFVMRDVFPDPQGTPVDLSTARPFHVETVVPLPADWVPQNLEVVAFVQDDSNALVYQTVRRGMPRELPWFRVVSTAASEWGRNGDGDGTLNPGEEGTIAVSVAADSDWGSATEIIVSLTSETNAVTVLSSTVALPDLAPGDTADIHPGELQVFVDPTSPVGNLPLSLHFTARWGNDQLYEQTIPVDLAVSLHQKGFPVSTGAEVTASLALVTFGIKTQESSVIVATDEDGFVHGLDATGSNLPGFPLQLGSPITTPAVADINGDATPEVVVGSANGIVSCLSLEGTDLWSIDLGSSVVGSPALGDVDGNNDLDIVVGTSAGSIWALNADGSVAPGWPVELGPEHVVETGFCLEDLDGDNARDIVAGTSGDLVVALSGNGTPLPGWPVELPGPREAGVVSTVLSDVGSAILVPMLDSNLHAFDARGNQVGVVSLEGELIATPAVSDLDGNGSLEIVVASSFAFIHVFDSSLSELPGWPIRFGTARIEASPTVADLDGNGIAEIVVGSDSGTIRVLDISGEQAATPVVLETFVRSAPAIGDFDGDGDIEVAVGNGSSIVCIDYKTSGGTTLGYWHQYRGFATRTGSFSELGVLRSPVDESLFPNRLVLYRPHPNPARSHTFARFHLPHPEVVTFRLYDPAGRVIGNLPRGPANKGMNGIRLDLSNVPQGVYFIKVSTNRATSQRPLIVLR